MAASVRGADNPAFCKRGPTIRRRRRSPWTARSVTWPCLTPRPEVHVRGRVLLDAPPAVRLRRQRHALDERRRAGRRVAQHEAVPRDGRRRQVSRLDGARSRHERQRSTRCLYGRERTDRPGERHAHQLAVLCGDAEPGHRSIWGSSLGVPGAVVRLSPGSNPPETALAEIYRVPAPGFGARGADIDRQGVVWVSLGSGHIGSFDRRKCKGPLNGPKAAGDRSPRGGPSTVPGRASGASGRTAPSPATPGSISTTRSGWATTCPCRRAI